MLKNINKKIKKNLQSTKGFLILSFGIILFLVVNLVILADTKTSLITMITNKLLDSNTKYTEEIKSITIKSDDYKDNEPGSWHIKKSADWIGKGKAKVTFNVDTVRKTINCDEDVILVIDISGSMSGNKLKKAKEDAIELVQELLSNENNKVALITFDTTSTIVSEFTNDKQTLIDKINSLTDMGSTNYNQALQNVDIVMNNYIKEEDKGVVTLFLTDGYPNEETPNQIGTYELLKEKYPYMIINGIQYEMGKDVIKQIKEISDNQWVASQETLDNVLFEAAAASTIYEKYEIVDYIDKNHFSLDREKGIEVSTGTYVIEEENGYEKVIWTLDSFATGSSATMNIYLTLKDETPEEGKFYPTNDREEIVSKLPDELEKQVKSTETPVLKNGYLVSYDTNAPSGCDLETIESKPHFVYENVIINQNKLSCKGYIFKGWKIVEEDVQEINDDVFIMPKHNVTIIATWSKPSIKKVMNGTVWVKSKTLEETIRELYNEEDESELFEQNNNIRYRGADPDNYVIFNDEIWRIIGIVDGKVKIIRDELLEETYNWDDSVFTGDWSKAGLKTYLNDTYYELIQSPYNEMIDENTWYLGSHDTSSVSVEAMYGYERGTSLCARCSQNKWTGKIALMYPSDYGYAADKSCSSNLGSYSSCRSGNWLFKGKTEWMLNQTSGCSICGAGAYVVASSGIMGSYYNNNAQGVRPSLYLSSDVIVTRGTGDIDNPYQLSM